MKFSAGHFWYRCPTISSSADETNTDNHLSHWGSRQSETQKTTMSCTRQCYQPPRVTSTPQAAQFLISHVITQQYIRTVNSFSAFNAWQHQFTLPEFLRIWRWSTWTTRLRRGWLSSKSTQSGRIWLASLFVTVATLIASTVGGSATYIAEPVNQPGAVLLSSPPSTELKIRRPRELH